MPLTTHPNVFILFLDDDVFISMTSFPGTHPLHTTLNSQFTAKAILAKLSHKDFAIGRWVKTFDISVSLQA